MSDGLGFDGDVVHRLGGIKWGGEFTVVWLSRRLTDTVDVCCCYSRGVGFVNWWSC